MSTTILVSNLALTIDSSMLEDMFSLVGDVRKAVVERDVASGRSRGFGFVEMSTSEEAKNCILHFNGQKKEGQTLMVRSEKSLTEKPPVEQATATGKVPLRVVRASNRKNQGETK